MNITITYTGIDLLDVPAFVAGLGFAHGMTIEIDDPADELRRWDLEQEEAAAEPELVGGWLELPKVEQIRRTPNPEDVVEVTKAEWLEAYDQATPIDQPGSQLWHLAETDSVVYDMLRDPRTTLGIKVVGLAACDYCGQPERTPCTTPAGASAQFTHIDRIRAACGVEK